MTRYSILGGVSQSGYKVGDIISFKSASHQGSFSQQTAIVVDAVNGGAITQWHFLWGGLYDVTDLPVLSSGTLVQDDTHSYCGSDSGTVVACGSTSSGIGATLTPAWSGWSVLNSETISNAGTGYAAGDIVALFQPTSTLVNQGHAPSLIVESTDTVGAVTAYDWLDFGSFNALPSVPTTLTAYSTTGTGANLAIGPVAWTLGPFATTIATVGTVGANTNIVLADQPPVAFPTGYTLTIQTFYFGDDDYAAINTALAAKPPSAINISGGCGTTKPLNLLRDASANNANAALVGANVQASGLYAFAYPLTQRHSGPPVLSQVLHAGLLNSGGNAFLAASGGGFTNLFVEAFGIPEGYGYYGLLQGVAALTGYKGPSSGAYTIPSAGTAVEIDAANLMRIDNVHIADGGVGPGNAAFQCGMDESDPTNAIGGKSANILFTNSRLDANPAFAAGPSNPDFALHLGASCHGSTFRTIAAYDGTKANVLQYNSNVFSQVHVDSSAVNATTAGAPAPTINWGTITTISSFGLAGAADYGAYILGATTLAQTVCGIANTACIFTIPNPAAGSLDAGQITDTQMRCAAFASVPSGYFAVRLGSGAANTTVSGTASAGRCAVRPVQLVHLDDPGNSTSASLSLCNNSNALVAGCSGYQGPFAAGQFYSQPAISYGTVAVTGNVLYAVPFSSPASGGAITRLGLRVTTIGSASLCEVGVYYAAGGLPTSLMLDGGALTVNNAGTLSPVATGLSTTLAPQTQYFLAVRCNGSVTLQGAVAGGSFTAPLVGSPGPVNIVTQITAPGTFGSGALPTAFNAGGAITSTAGPVPNVYAGP